MKAADIAHYLQNNPQFFEDHASMLAEITIPHPYGGRTISLSERQLLTLREKNRALEKKLHEVVEIAHDNDALQLKVHQFACSLYGADTLTGLSKTIVRNIRQIFSAPDVALHIWRAHPPSAEVLAFAEQLTQPVCTHHAVHDTLSWFGEGAERLRSFSYLPLRQGEQTTGLLVLASEDAQRFYPEMGTVFLQRIADIAGSALQVRL